MINYLNLNKFQLQVFRCVQKLAFQVLGVINISLYCLWCNLFGVSHLIDKFTYRYSYSCHFSYVGHYKDLPTCTCQDNRNSFRLFQLWPISIELFLI